MYLKFDDGTKIRVGQKSVFEILTKARETELRVSPLGKGAFRHISWHYGRPSAETQLAQIQAAINRGDKVFNCDDVKQDKGR